MTTTTKIEIIEERFKALGSINLSEVEDLNVEGTMTESVRASALHHISEIAHLAAKADEDEIEDIQNEIEEALRIAQQCTTRIIEINDLMGDLFN